MLIRLFSILDTAAEAFNTPFTSRTVPEAMRNFTLSVTRDETVRANARDYVLYEVGAFDMGTGNLVPLQEPRRIFSADEAIKKFEAFEVERLKELTPSAQK